VSSIIKVNTVQDTDGNNIINENANTITIGKSGDTVQVASGATLLGGGVDWQSTIVTGATHTVSANQGIWIDTSSNACTLTLPASPSVGDQVIFTDYARNWGTNAVTLNLNSEKFQGNTTPVPVYDTNGESVNIVYSGSTKGWIPNTDGAVALETPQTTTADFLVIAGGGGGGFDRGGGAGAGGYRASFNSETSGGGGSSESSLTLQGGSTYTITVGAGGAGATGTGAIGVTGGNSVISGSGITTITSNGGGGGGNGAGGLSGGNDGGCGGGGAATTSGGAGDGTTNQGYGGGNGTGSPSLIGGAGGGAGEAGNTDGQGYGGDGVASTISGSSVVRGGGGSGTIDNTSPIPGGDGGGGAGGGNGSGYPPTAGTANTGGGGGGDDASGGRAAAGGSGVVILRMATASYSGTTSGSPTVDQSTVSGQTILIYNASGSYTA
jgi:hypothetical protein